LWCILFFLYVISLLCIIAIIKSAQSRAQTVIEENKNTPITTRQWIMWIGLSFTSSLLLLGVTNQLTQGIANIPFVWIVPLLLYLCSFIFSFTGKPLYKRSIIAFVFLLSVAGIFISKYYDYRLSFGVHIFLYALFLLSACLVLHDELYAQRPARSGLTSFYLAISIGGAGGGFLTSFIAPYIFNAYQEFYVATGGAICIALYLLFTAKGAAWNPKKKEWYVFCSFCCVGLFLLAIFRITAEEGEIVIKKRNFYGILDVRASESPHFGKYRIMRHGLIKHGIQFESDALHTYPTAYFYPESGIGTVLTRHQKRIKGVGMKVGIIGLGIGVLSAYAQPNDEFRYYEIDPYVHILAEKYFTYLGKSPAKTHVVYGDGRLLMQEEIENDMRQTYDVFVVDAFSGGTIPVHLLTKEAFELYDQHLEKSQGVIALNITNKFVNLVPQIKSVSQELGFTFVVIETQGNGTVAYDATWAIMTRDKEFIDNNFIVLKEEEDIEGCSLWTDGYSNLLAVLK